MSKATIETTMTGARSHSVKLGGPTDETSMSGIDREEVFPTFATDWRGVAVVVQMNANRYRHSSGVSEWRIHVERGIEGTDPYGRGKAISDTARSRLTDRLEPLVLEWLESDDYRQSKRAAVVHALARELAERTYVQPASARAWEYAGRLASGEMTREQWAAFAAACKAKDAAAAALEAFTSPE